MYIKDIKGIGITNAEKLNTLGIRTTDDVRKLGWQKMSMIKYLGAKQLSLICNASGIKITDVEIRNFRNSFPKRTIDKTKIKNNKPTPTLKIKSKKLNKDKLSEIIERGKGRMYWNISNFDGEFATVQINNPQELEKILIDHFPNNNTDNILRNAFEQLDYKVKT